MSTAIYSGTFDGLTFGHIDIIKQAHILFDSVSVLVANNANKKCMLTPKERLECLNMWKSITGIRVGVMVWEGLTVDFAPLKKDRVLVRGIRNVTDMMEEIKLADINEELSGIKTVFIPTSNQYRNISSSMVKELLRHNKDVYRYCPEYVVDKLKEKMK